MTAEAAVAVPVFFLAVVTMLYLLEMMAVHTAVRSGLQYAGKKAAKESCVTQMLMPSRIENDLVYAVGEERLGRSIVRGGSSGIDCSRSKMSARTGIGKLTAEYQVVIPVPLFGIAPVKCSEKMKIKAWSGYEREGWMDTGNDTVYVTETGFVYHKDYHCSHLDLSIRMTHLELVEGLRNENGGKYYPCEHCVKGNGGNIYITNSGDRYHSSLSCSGLKRTIYAIPISEAAGKGACSRCGQ
ncbi:MAG: pilus assembly protein [Dorea sp.]|nr:pilus assembly protein [Dorea sp.]